SPEGSAVMREQLVKIIKESGAENIDNDVINAAVQAITQDFTQYAFQRAIEMGINPIEMDQDTRNQLFQEYIETERGQEVVDTQSQIMMNEVIENVDITPEQAQEISQALLDNYSKYATENNLPDPNALEDSFKEYMDTDRAKNMITYVVATSFNTDEIMSTIMSNISGMTSQMAGQLASGIQDAITLVVERLASNMTTALQNTFEDFGSALTVDQDAFAAAFKFNMGESELQSFMSEMMGNGTSSAEGNLAAFGYCEKDNLQSITIYPKDFESKDQITQILKDYNKMVEDAGEEDKSIVYTDIVGALMKSVTKIINTISYVLIAFVAISLVVSSIMIGVITYISVLERRKEIGILRAMGASKHNVAQVFNAETMITGFLAGLFGVGISLFLLIPINALIHKLAESDDVSAVMPWAAAIVLVLLSIFLTFVGGLIPSKSASRQDPVTALRTE
ncbi:MAG: ABC transporter permease, partial [Clostridiales bacterium]|nr:ABC transporter permease [Clostridiales bacterium]